MTASRCKLECSGLCTGLLITFAEGYSNDISHFMRVKKICNVQAIEKAKKSVIVYQSYYLLLTSLRSMDEEGIRYVQQSMQKERIKNYILCVFVSVCVYNMESGKLN